MGSEAGQPLADIIRRKDLERECGAGVFAWGIGNSIGPGIKHAKVAEQVSVLEALFTPMKAAPKAIDVTPSSIVMWLGYLNAAGVVEPLPEHMLITSRGQSSGGEEKRAHYALICRASESLAGQHVQQAIDQRAVRNLVSSNPVGASQVTSVVRYCAQESRDASYPVLFRAELAGPASVRLAVPVTLQGNLLDLYRALCASSSPREWRAGIQALKAAAGVSWPPSANCEQGLLFT